MRQAVLQDVGKWMVLQAEKMKKVTLNEVAHSIFYAPQYAAIELGYFEEEGIDLTLVNGAGADKVMTALISGDAQIGFMGSEASIYVSQEGADDPAVNFAQLTQRAGNFLVGRTAQPDFKWEDLEGKESFGRKSRWRTYINVNYETIVILCNWVDGLNSAKKSQKIE